MDPAAPITFVNVSVSVPTGSEAPSLSAVESAASALMGVFSVADNPQITCAISQYHWQPPAVVDPNGFIPPPA